MIDLSVVVPVYNEAGSIETLVRDLERELVPLLRSGRGDRRRRRLDRRDAADPRAARARAPLARRPARRAERRPRRRGHARAQGRPRRVDLPDRLRRPVRRRRVPPPLGAAWRAPTSCSACAPSATTPRTASCSRAPSGSPPRCSRGVGSGTSTRPSGCFAARSGRSSSRSSSADTLAPNILVTLGAAVRGWRIVDVPVTHLAREGGTSTPARAASVRFSLRGLGQLVAFRYRLARAPAPAERTRGRRRMIARPARPFGCGARRSRVCVRGRPPGGAKPSRSPRSPCSGSRCGSSVSTTSRLHHDESLHAWFGVAARQRGRLQLRPRLPRAGAVLPHRARRPPVRRRRLRRAHPGRARRDDRGLPAVLPAPAARHRRRAHGLRSRSASRPSFLYFSRFAARGHPRGDRHARARRRPLAVLRPAAALAPAVAARPARRQLRDEGDDVHHRLRRRTVPRRGGRRAGHARATRRSGACSTARSSAASCRSASPPGRGACRRFLVVYTLLFSTFLTNPGGLQEGLWGSIDYWLGQQDVNRGGQPWFYYLILIPAYEWPIVILGAVGIVVALRRRTIGDLFLVWMFLSLLAIFSWASERMPWLVLHPLLPLVLLAGIGAQALWLARGRWAARSRSASSASPRSAPCTSRFSFRTSGRPIRVSCCVQVQTADDVPRIRDELMRLEAAYTREHGEPFVPVVDSWGGTGWPWSWYLRDVPSGYYDMSNPEAAQLGPVVLVSDPSHAGDAIRAEGLRGEGNSGCGCGGCPCGALRARRLAALGRLAQGLGPDADGDDGRVALRQAGGRRAGERAALEGSPLRRRRTRDRPRVSAKQRSAANPANSEDRGCDDQERQDVQGVQHERVGERLRVRRRRRRRARPPSRPRRPRARPGDEGRIIASPIPITTSWPASGDRPMPLALQHEPECDPEHEPGKRRPGEAHNRDAGADEAHEAAGEMLGSPLERTRAGRTAAAPAAGRAVEPPARPRRGGSRRRQRARA